jgi:hypothetical protein
MLGVAEGWRIEAEDEVDEWLVKLPARDAARARFYLELLAKQGSALSMPYVRSLGDGLGSCDFMFATSSDASPSGSHPTGGLCC